VPAANGHHHAHKIRTGWLREELMSVTVDEKKTKKFKTEKKYRLEMGID